MFTGRGSIGLGAAALVTLASLVPPYLAGFLLDRVVRPAQGGALGRGEAARLAWLAVGAMAALYIVRQAAAHVRLRLMSVLGEWVARDLRSELYSHIQRLSLSFFSRKKTGSLITRVTADTDRLWEFIAFGVVDVSLSVVMLLGLGAVLLTLDWRLGLIMTLPVPVFCWMIYWHGESLNARFIRTWRQLIPMPSSRSSRVRSTGSTWSSRLCRTGIASGWRPTFSTRAYLSSILARTSVSMTRRLMSIGMGTRTRRPDCSAVSSTAFPS